MKSTEPVIPVPLLHFPLPLLHPEGVTFHTRIHRQSSAFDCSIEVYPVFSLKPGSGSHGSRSADSRKVMAKLEPSSDLHIGLMIFLDRVW
jgi:hypothetical protein